MNKPPMPIHKQFDNFRHYLMNGACMKPISYQEKLTTEEMRRAYLEKLRLGQVAKWN